MTSPETKTPLEDFLTPEQTAMKLGVSHNAVRQAIDDGKLAASRIGKAILIEYADAVAWVRSLKTTKETP